MGFDQQIAQADLLSTETPLTNSIGLTNKRIHADKMTQGVLDRGTLTNFTASLTEETKLQTATRSENINQGMRMPTKIQVTSLDPLVDFSESFDPVSVNAQGCAMHSAKRIAVGTRVLLRIQAGTEATGQVAFCKASSSGDKLWGLGVVLDKLENCRLSSCPKDHATGDDDADVLLDDKGIDGGVAPPESGCIPDFISGEADTMRVELREQMRKEMDAILTDASAKLEEQLQAQRRNTAFAEALLQDAADVRSSTAIPQSLPETPDRKVTDGVEDALQQIGVRMDTLTLRAQSDSEQLQEKIRGVGDEMNRQARQSVLAELEKVQHQLYEDQQVLRRKAPTDSSCDLVHGAS